MNAPALITPQTVVPNLRELCADGHKVRLDISNEQYHADRSCVSCSGLKEILRSPAHFRVYLDGERKETPAMFFGSAVHARLLEPDVFAAEYVVAPVGDKRTADFKSFLIANAHKKILTPEQMVLIEGIEQSALAHNALRGMLIGGYKEATIIWQDEETGIWLKIRPDCLCPGDGGGMCLDLKTTDDASGHAFARACVDYQYDLQSAMYIDGLLHAFRRDFDFAFGALEKSEPFGCGLYGAPEEMLLRGKRRFREALATLKRCLNTGEWPGYQPDGDYEILEWPRWAA